MSSGLDGEEAGDESPALFQPRASTGFLAGAAFVSVLTCALIWQDNIIFLAFALVLAVLSLISGLLALPYLIQSMIREGGRAQYFVEFVLAFAVAPPAFKHDLVRLFMRSVAYGVRAL